MGDNLLSRGRGKRDLLPGFRSKGVTQRRSALITRSQVTLPAGERRECHLLDDALLGARDHGSSYTSTSAIPVAPFTPDTCTV